MLKKINANYTFKKKRDFSLITPCCNKKNKDGKFVNYNELPNVYGFCHSCGKAMLPPFIYQDEDGNKYLWNETLRKFESLLSFSTSKFNSEKAFPTNTLPRKPKTKFISESIVWNYYRTTPENNLLKYLRKTYGNERTNRVKEMYAIGTYDDGGTVFWNINKELKVQKAKISFYDLNGKRTNQFRVPYKNEQGYFSCLFGEHLIIDKFKGKQILILVESEKTAIVGDINMPKYTWLAYGGINGLTNEKLKPLIGHTVLIVPDLSRKAVEIMYTKQPLFSSIGINAKIWDMTDGKSDEQIKNEGIYNMDLEDFIRKIKIKSNTK